MEIVFETDRYRIGIEYDTDADNPRTAWDTANCGFVKIAGRGDLRRIDVAPVYDPPFDIERAHDEFENTWGWASAEDTVVRWARIFHNAVVEYDAEHGGYWFVDPDRLRENFPPGEDGLYSWGEERVTKTELERKLIDSDQDEYRRWAEGEVFGVIAEEQVGYARLNADGTVDDRSGGDPDLTLWEQVDSVWGCYFDDPYDVEAARTALDLLSIPDEFAAAIREWLPKEAAA